MRRAAATHLYGRGNRSSTSESESQAMLSSLLDYNGERLDPVSGAYHLGNGYRAYNPVLMRFNCPDDWSPFGAGGINPYTYCAGDPVNHTDPSGHLSWQAWLGIGLGAFSLALSVFTAGASIAAAGGVMVAIDSASMTSLAVGGAGMVSDVTAIASGAVEDSPPSALAALGWFSMATGMVGLAHGLFPLVKRGYGMMHGTYAETSRALSDGFSSEVSFRGEVYVPARFEHYESGNDAGGHPGGFTYLDAAGSNKEYVNDRSVLSSRTVKVTDTPFEPELYQHLVGNLNPRTARVVETTSAVMVLMRGANGNFYRVRSDFVWYQGPRNQITVMPNGEVDMSAGQQMRRNMLPGMSTTGDMAYQIPPANMTQTRAGTFSSYFLVGRDELRQLGLAIPPTQP
nr:RHS repeat-associated core domain-containing protein [Herbaspirillum sp. CF444]